VLAGRTLSSDLRYYQRVPTLQGDEVRIIKWFGNVWVDRSRVTTPDVLATNGVIHVINRVLIPRGFTLEAGAAKFSQERLDAIVEAAYPDEAPPETFQLEYLESAK